MKIRLSKLRGWVLTESVSWSTHYWLGKLNFMIRQLTSILISMVLPFKPGTRYTQKIPKVHRENIVRLRFFLQWPSTDPPRPFNLLGINLVWQWVSFISTWSVWTQIRPVKMSNLILILSIWFQVGALYPWISLYVEGWYNSLTVWTLTSCHFNKILGLAWIYTVWL